MTKQQHSGRQVWVWLLALWVVGSLASRPGTAWAAGNSGGGQPATPVPWEWAPSSSLDGQTLVYAPGPIMPDPAPTETAETWTNPAFWIVVGLVVLGSLILMADFPENG